MVDDDGKGNKPKVSIEDILTEIKKEYDAKLDGISHKIEGELADLMIKPVQLAMRKNELYSLRQELARYRLDLMKRSSLVSRIRKQVKSDLYLSYKLGKRAGGAGAIVFKNDYERNTFMENDLRYVDFVKDYIDGLILMINDSMSTLKDMVYGIGYVIELENKYKVAQ